MPTSSGALPPAPVLRLVGVGVGVGLVLSVLVGLVVGLATGRVAATLGTTVMWGMLATAVVLVGLIALRSQRRG